MQQLFCKCDRTINSRTDSLKRETTLSKNKNKTREFRENNVFHKCQDQCIAQIITKT